jgi:hypothetical protein
MSLSPYFHDLQSGYEAEIDDLTSDSEGKDVLQRRLKDKRSQFPAIVGLIDTDMLLLAPAFHGAFQFPAHRTQRLEDLLSRGPGDFPAWSEIAGFVEVAGWAQPMIEVAMQEPLGDDFMATVVGLEYARLRHRGRGGAAWAEGAGEAEGGEAERDEDRDEDRDFGDGSDEEGEGLGRDDEALGEDFLEDQGFDRKTPR